MTVRELRQKLEGLPNEMEVVVPDHEEDGFWKVTDSYTKVVEVIESKSQEYLECGDYLMGDVSDKRKRQSVLVVG